MHCVPYNIDHEDGNFLEDKFILFASFIFIFYLFKHKFTNIYIYITRPVGSVFLQPVWLGFGLVSVQSVWFDRVDTKLVVVCYCGLRYWACPLLSFIGSAPIAKSWPCCSESLVSLGLCVVIESCWMHLWHTL